MSASINASPVKEQPARKNLKARHKDHEGDQVETNVPKTMEAQDGVLNGQVNLNHSDIGGLDKLKSAQKLSNPEAHNYVSQITGPPILPRINDSQF